LPAYGATTEEGLDFFEKRIRPILAEHCYDCHDADKGKTKGGLNLASREGWMKGGESGASVTPGKPDDSLLITAVRYWDKDLQMPPKKPLKPTQVEDLIEWVKMGAPDPRIASQPASVATEKSADVMEKGRGHWAFQPVKVGATPAVKDASWVRNEVDNFILARIEAAGAKPAPDADARTLIRRVTFDLTGLPPTPDEVATFVAESLRDPQSAFRDLVDRLLASPSYGERWGRHWLDLTRYADTCGNASDYPVPQAYKYRDYVIRAFNDDMPYDRFIREQLAGDLSPTAVTAGGTETAPVIATGYLASARHFSGGAGEPHLTIEDAIENIGRTFLGLSLSCARCHDHKFDPIPTTDYYALYGILSSSVFPHPGSEGKSRPENLAALLPKAELEAAKRMWEEKLAALDAEAKAREADKAAAEKEPDSAERKGKIDAAAKAVAAAKEQRRILKETPPFELAYSVTEGKPANSRLQVRGDPKRLGEEVPRHFLTILGGTPLGAQNSGRPDLAAAITNPKNPLTARVLVNRLWQHHFGRGLVATPNDFGTRGLPPTHPELLDFLAQKFIDSGWSIKAMHRVMLLSHTWQLSSQNPDPTDPENKLWSRAERRRLDAESIRDSLLFVSGGLDLTPGGAHPFPAVHTWGFTQHNQFFAVYDTKQRAVYQMQQRLRRHPFLGLFDGPDPNSSTATRQQSTTPLQSLFMMNDKFIHERAIDFSARITAVSNEDMRRMEVAFLTLFGRPPQPDELQLITAYLAKFPTSEKAWQSLSRALLASNEFIHLD
jgi:hypothetical protein